MIKFFLSDMPNRASHTTQESCGFSLYKGILIQWDEDTDDRIIRVIDELPKNVLDRILVIQEHEGSINFVWKNYIPYGYDEMCSINVPDGDIWSIGESKVLQDNIKTVSCKLKIKSKL